MLFPAFCVAVWSSALWHAWRHSAGVELRALNNPSHWAGEAFLFRLEARSFRSRVQRDLTVTLAAPNAKGAPSNRPIAFISRLEPNARQVVPCGYRQLHRGRETELHLSLHSVFPFAIFRVERHYDLPVEFLAWPRLGSWRAPLLASPAPFRDQQNRSRRRGDEEFYQLAPWRPGMARRRIHWKHSARRAQVLIQELEGPGDEDVSVALLLSTPKLGVKRGAGRAPFETAVGLVATLVNQHLRRGATVRLLLLGEEAVALPGLRGRTGRRLVMDTLALVAGVPRGPNEFAQDLESAMALNPTQLVYAGETTAQRVTPPRRQHVQLLDVQDPAVDRYYRRATDTAPLERDSTAMVVK